MSNKYLFACFMLFFTVSGFLCIVRGGALALWGHGLCLSLLDKVGASDDVFKSLNNCGE